jgi:hypothetical protein
MEAITQQSKYVAMILYLYKHPWGGRLLVCDAAYQILMKFTTKTFCAVFWWGTWYAYGDKWFFLWGVYLPVSVVVLMALQLWGNGIQTLIALKAIKKERELAAETDANADAATEVPRGRISKTSGLSRMSSGTIASRTSSLVDSLDMSGIHGHVGLGDLYVDDDENDISQPETLAAALAVNQTVGATDGYLFDHTTVDLGKPHAAASWTLPTLDPPPTEVCTEV